MSASPPSSGQQHRTIQVDGFYDGDGAYKVRFSPDTEGEWTLRTHSNRPELDGQTGALPSAFRNRPQSRSRFRAQYLPFRLRRRHALPSVRHHLLRLDASGRRARGADHRHAAPSAVQQDAHVHLPQVVRRTTSNEPPVIRSRAPPGRTTTRASTPCSSRISKSAIAQLQALGIEADLILFHPYDHWGYAQMPPEVDDRYLRYVVARLAAFRNVWWSWPTNGTW